MKTVSFLLAALMVANVTAAGAAVSADEAKKLGTTLTPFGAEMAGNKEGTIPAYTGGLSKPPAGYTRKGNYVDPFPDEKPTLRIDASNWEKNKDNAKRAMKKLYAPIGAKLQGGITIYCKTAPTKMPCKDPDNPTKDTPRGAPSIPAR